MVDPNGNVVGMVTSKIVGGDVEGLGFAVSSQHIAAMLGLTLPGRDLTAEVVVKPGFCPARNQGFTVPPIPNVVSGSVFVVGSPARDGLQVVARLQTKAALGECWSDATVTEGGQYSLLIAYPDSTEFWFPVEIYVVGFKVAEIQSDRPDHAINLDLYLPPESAPTPTPSPTPTPAPTLAAPTPTPSPGADGTVSVVSERPAEMELVAAEVLQFDGTWMIAEGLLTTEVIHEFTVHRLAVSAPSTEYFGLRLKLTLPGQDPTDWIEIIQQFRIFAGSRTDLNVTISVADLTAAGLF